ncbi:hypothetical protein ARAM_004402 [Aspergillus rambellii]|uniref:Xylanolytic transcriptional activator regulatory domain-containing protein n=1 Tax=Aspergillus rambellii TaxID=308745 RepID=A0A0F8VME2_9EURO|nr:hypothetical protein ARAM_004402 [Aspergillus rambellii]
MMLQTPPSPPDQINEFKESLRDSDELSDEDAVEYEPVNENAPTILFGLGKTATKEELLTDLPSRTVADRLVSLFINSNQPAVVILHIPTFHKQYNQFWTRPQDVSLPWLGMLYAILSLGVLFHQRSGDSLEGVTEDQMDIINTSRKRSAQCLSQSNYTLAGRYKVEGLFLYTMVEFYMSNDAQIGVSLLLGITVKLAMRMGYHRDPDQFPAISVFDGEMRRRMWVFLYQLDTLIAFEIGIPRTILDWHYDTALPRNLSDEHYNENTKKLPPPRPENEVTTTSYTIAKARLMATFGKILDMAYSREPVTYEEALELDRQMDEAHDLVPPVFRARPIDQCIMDPPELIVRRYTLENTYQKARCVLHRRYLGEVHSNLRYAYSRVVCITAAKQILRGYADIYRENQPGGLMYRNRYFPNSIQYTDNLLAAMILCMELSYSHAAGGALAVRPNDDVAVVIRDRDDLLSTLEESHQILNELRKRSVDAQKAYAALTIMLRRVKKGLHTIPPPKSSIFSSSTTDPTTEPELELEAEPVTTSNQPPAYGSWQDLESLDNQPYPLDISTGFMTDPMTSMDTPFASLDVIGEMLDTPANLNWNLWDRQIHDRPDLNGNGLCVISSVESYAQFLPFLTASTVTARDPETGYPTRAFLTVGYGPLSETFTSKVTCDPGTWVVEARSGAKFGVDSKQGQRGSSGSAGGIAGFLDFPGANEGVFEFLSTRWELVPLEEKSGSETTVKLEIRFEFKNMWHAKMMSALEGQMAGVMIEAFERRIKEIHG